MACHALFMHGVNKMNNGGLRKMITSQCGERSSKQPASKQNFSATYDRPWPLAGTGYFVGGTFRATAAWHSQPVRGRPEVGQSARAIRVWNEMMRGKRCEDASDASTHQFRQRVMRSVSSWEAITCGEESSKNVCSKKPGGNASN